MVINGKSTISLSRSPVPPTTGIQAHVHVRAQCLPFHRCKRSARLSSILAACIEALAFFRLPIGHVFLLSTFKRFTKHTTSDDSTLYHVFRVALGCAWQRSDAAVGRVRFAQCLIYLYKQSHHVLLPSTFIISLYHLPPTFSSHLTA